MKSDSGETVSVWMATVKEIPSDGKLMEDVRADVCIVGKPGDGAIVRHGLKKVAAYRDEAGALHQSSAVCVHLGCIVDWNSKEKSWDCPCHGSRYDAYGKVFQGPANSNLEPVEED